MTAADASDGLDVRRARRDTPGCRDVVHLNNAGAALAPAAVTEAVIDHLRLEARRGGYEAAAEAQEATDDAYAAVADLLGCRRDEIAMVESATRAWQLAFSAFRFGPGDRILVSRVEYASSVIALLQAAERTGARLELVDDDPHGQLDVEDLRRRLDDDVKLVALTHVPTSSGLVNPVAEVGAVTREAGVPFLLDACQSVGQLAVRPEEIGCDLLAATGRKYLRGPRGTGFLYVSRHIVERLEPPLLDLHGARWTAPDRYVARPGARRFETWEHDVAARIGLGVAARYAHSLGIAAIERRVTRLGELLRERLGSIDGVRVHDKGLRRCGIVTFTVDGAEAADVRRTLAGRGINTSVSSVADSRIDLPARGLPDLVRASVHYYNTEQELDRLRDEVARIRAGQALQ
jgi:cysteine desulfurase/selenocysteine lyase